MESNTLILYASVEGQTLKLCKRLMEILKNTGHKVTLLSISSKTDDLEQYDKIILASSIRYGKHHEDMIAFVHKNEDLLNMKKSVFISVSLVARKTEKSSAETNPYVKRFLGGLKWTPDKVGVFAGMLDYAKYSFIDKWLIRLIMLMTKGPIFPKGAIEYTDWDSVDLFSKEVAQL